MTNRSIVVKIVIKKHQHSNGFDKKLCWSQVTKYKCLYLNFLHLSTLIVVNADVLTCMYIYVKNCL